MVLYKRAYIAAPQHLLQRCRNTQASMHEMECSSSRALLHDLWLPSLLGWVDFSLLQPRNISPFIPSQLLLEVR